VSNSNAEFVVGMDLSDKKISVCVLDAAGEVVRRQTVPNDQDGVTGALASFAERERVTVVLETGSHSRWVSQLAQALGFRVLVGDARKLRAIWAADNKQDVRDAEMLARLARFDAKLLSPITPRGEAAHLDLAVVKARDLVVEIRTKLVNFVRGTLKCVGVALPSCSTEAFVKVVQEKNTEALLWPALTPVLTVIATLTAQIREYDRELERLAAEKYPQTERLRQVTGVGPVTSLAYVLTLDRPERFVKSRDVGPYLGLVPRRDQSGEADKPLGITKAGNSLLRRLLVNAAAYILGPFGPDCDLRRHGERVASRGGKVAKRKARVAVARKLAVLLHHLWQTGEEYVPLRHAPRNVTPETTPHND